MAKFLWSFKWAYAGLWLVRVWFAFYGTGYIHPDEHMQNGEVTAGSILGFHTLTTWEWVPDLPVRSVLPPFITTGLPLFILKLLFRHGQRGSVVRPSLIFGVERFAFLCLSSILDYSVLELVSLPAHRRLCLLLLASSYVTWTFQVRPFSNSLESVLVSLSLVLLRRIVDTRTLLKAGGKFANDQESHLFRVFKRNLHLLAVLVVVGIFTRPTFVVFAIPIGLQVLRLSFEVARSPVQAIGLLLPPFCSATVTASVFIAADTYYFCGDLSKMVVTPYNFIKYNLSTDNLAAHGIHPRWLHISVNLPMLLGPLFVRFTWCGIHNFVKLHTHRNQKVHFETDIVRQTSFQIVILSLLILSAQPHQEPRFLMPLVPLIIVLGSTSKLPRPGKLFWTTWIMFNVVLALVFGILHQGGVVPSLFSLHSILGNAAADSSTHIVFWKTYLPPRHFLGVSQRDVPAGKVAFTDLAGASENELMAAISTSSFGLTYLVTPVPTALMLPQAILPCMTLKERIFAHLDLDHVPESIQAGGRDALSLGIYAIDRECWLISTLPSNVGPFVT